MQPTAPVLQQPSLLSLVIRAGGIHPLVFTGLALMLTLWGLINLAFVRNRFALAAQALLSFTPLAYACAGLLGALARFQQLVTAPGPGDPQKIADTMSLTFLFGFLGSVSTAIPAVVGIFALARNVRGSASPIGKGVVGDL